jgi:hypothetical protein
MSKLSRTIPTEARSGRHAAPNLPAWMIADLNRAETDHLAPLPLQLGLPTRRAWEDEPIEGETEGMLTLDL